MSTKRKRKLFLSILAIIGFAAVFLLLVFPERTANRVLRDVSKLEFRLLAMVSSRFAQTADPDGPHIILASHRGVVTESGVENSLQSIEEALRNGFRSLEVDISFSSDFEPYLFHGPGRESVGLSGRFSDYSSHDIEPLRLANGQPIVSLGEFCRLYGNKFERTYLDIKGDNSYHRIKARNLCQAIGNYEPERFVLIGVPWRVIREVKNAMPLVDVGFEEKGAIANYLLGGDMVSLHYKYEFSFAEYKLAKLVGLSVLIWTVNDPKLLKDISRIYRLSVLTDLRSPQELSMAGVI